MHIIIDFMDIIKIIGSGIGIGFISFIIYAIKPDNNDKEE